jgi:hypothetical protein
VVLLGDVRRGGREELERGLIVHEVGHVTRQVHAVHQMVVPGLQEVVMRYVIIV